MPGYNHKITKYIPQATVLMRLTPEATRFLYGRIMDALNKKKGVNLIFQGWRGAISLVESPEQGKEVKLIVFGEKGPVCTEQKGYTGKWSHCEMAVKASTALPLLRDFLNSTEGA